MIRVPSADVVIWGGLVISPGIPAESTLVIRNSRIDEIRPAGAFPEAALVIDARDKVVLPGVVDCHVHVETPGPEGKPLGVYSDSFETMSQSAASGGVTTVMPFVFSNQETSPARYIERCRSVAEAESWVDFSFHFGIVRESDVEAIPDLAKMGILSFKAMMDYKRQGVMVSDRLLLASMEAISQQGGLMMVHAEDGEIIEYLEERAQAAGQKDPPAYARTRPPIAERLAVFRALALAEVTDCPLYIVHLSTQMGLEVARIAKERGQRVFIETCPHYLLLTQRELEADRLGPLAKIGPPLRLESDNVALWAGIVGGTVDVIGSDHAPRTKTGKLRGMTDIFAAPFGGPGVETLLPVLFDEFRRRDLPLTLLCTLLSEMPARIFGLFPHKGVIAQNADADIVIIDPQVSWTITPERLHTRADYTLWAGHKLVGKPVSTFVRGKPVMLDGELCGKSGWGRFLPRQRG